ncbi:MAG: hypothetical protein JW983_00175 [Elusimicrobia bacterium]|nr:hypothetical protein [Elusimicrobiota bacterium]
MKKTKYLFFLLLLVLIFNLSLVLNGCGIIREQEKENEYLSEVAYIMRALADDSNFYSEESSDLSAGRISLSSHKETTKKLIEEIKDFYSQYMELTPPERLKTTHKLLGESFEHYNNSCYYLQEYVDANSEIQMEESFNQATLEWNEGSRYWLEARDELQSFLESEGDKYQEFKNFLK